MSNLSLLGVQSRVEVPFVKVTIGDYTFGIFEKQDLKRGIDAHGVYKTQKIKYPNYIQSLTVTKINGRVNKYTLVLTYPITPKDDPNFFERVFSSVSKTRKMVLSYGDMAVPTYIYRNEEAIITKINSSFNMSGSTIQYTISAVSTAVLAISGLHSFNSRKAKPSDVIKEILYNNSYGLLEVFPGMRDRGKVELEQLIPGDDISVELSRKVNVSVLDYLSYLVENMSSGSNTLKKNKVYLLTIVDDTSGDWEGPYFKITPLTKLKDNMQTYVIDIGYPSQNIVTNFTVDEDSNYSIYYDYQNKINDAEYTQRINDRGEIEEVYAPALSIGKDFDTNTSEMTWWTKVTEFPTAATITLKGLLRPTILMTHVRLNMYYYGKKHISSGLYIVTSQEDKIDFQGYRTTLKLIRVSGDV